MYEYLQKFDMKHLEEIRNEFFKYINIINAQETDKEQPKPSFLDDIPKEHCDHYRKGNCDCKKYCEL